MSAVPEVLVAFDEAVASESGTPYAARVLATTTPLGHWEGRLEFAPLAGGLPTLSTDRETTQPNRADLEYWATGLTRVYLQGALVRALDRGAER